MFALLGSNIAMECKKDIKLIGFRMLFLGVGFTGRILEGIGAGML